MSGPGRAQRYAPLLYLAAALSVAGYSYFNPNDGVSFGLTRLDVNGRQYTVELASDERQRERGLMFRRTLTLDSGMAFVFDRAAKHCMWMKNTELPLSVAFVDSEGKILNMENMSAETLEDHCSAGPALYALEMNLGWFKQHAVTPGMVIVGFRSPG